MQKFKLFLVVWIIVVGHSQLFAQVDTVKYNNPILVPQQLHVGQTKYLVYSEDSVTQKKSGISIWERNISFEKIGDKDVFVIRQVWNVLDTNNTKREIISKMDASSFLPLYHHTLITASHGRRRADAFIFKNDSIVATDIANVDNKSFALAIGQPVFNWELDMETFAQLPLKKGKTFVIPFYHPGSKTLPAFYTYKVEGEDQLAGIQGNVIDCWRLVYKDELTGNYSIWWLNKTTHTVMKMKENYNGKLRYKILMYL